MHWTGYAENMSESNLKNENLEREYSKSQSPSDPAKHFDFYLKSKLKSCRLFPYKSWYNDSKKTFHNFVGLYFAENRIVIHTVCFILINSPWSVPYMKYHNIIVYTYLCKIAGEIGLKNARSKIPISKNQKMTICSI